MFVRLSRFEKLTILYLHLYFYLFYAIIIFIFFLVVVVIIIIINDCYHRIMEQFRLEWISEDILVLLPLLRQCRLELMDWDHAYLPFADL